MTENRVEKARFYHDISQCEKIVCELEENVLQINKEGIVEDTDMGQNMSISGPIRIIQWDEKQYVWFYTSSLLSGESTGYFHQHPRPVPYVRLHSCDSRKDRCKAVYLQICVA